ncbi:MAG: magnesium transporter [Pirellulales bacterium]|nr:magnesium transporter [Pirellulales bacterium]
MCPNTLYIPELREMLSSGDESGLREFCTALHPAAVADFTNMLEWDEAWKVLIHTDPQTRSEIFSFYELSRQVDFIENLSPQDAAQLVGELSPDDRVDLLEETEPAVVDEFLSLLPENIRRNIFHLQRYEEDTAGSMMTTDFACLQQNTTVQNAISSIASQAENLETVYYLYVVDNQDRLSGVLSARDLVSSIGRPDVVIGDLMDTHVISVDADEDTEEVAEQVAKYDLLAIPVVDKQHRMLGIITHDDVIDVMREQATEETQRIGGVAPLDESYLRASIPRLTWNRGIWLIILFIGALLTAFALEQYRDGPLTTAWLVLFIPLIISSGGNSGSQSATLIISALSAGHITPRDWMRIIARELAQGVLLGVVLGLIGYLAALWLGPDNPQHYIHALTVPITVLLVVIAGTLLGAMLPLIFESIGWDPALMSTPFIAGIIDVVGIVIYMTVAILLISGSPV